MHSEFPEPRGWALRWEGTALLPTADCVSRDAAAQEAAVDAGETEATGWALQWRRFAESSASPSRNGNGWNGLARPLGWSLKWDGAALADEADRDERASLRLVEREKDGAA